jgi:hypothetical protein
LTARGVRRAIAVVASTGLLLGACLVDAPTTSVSPTATPEPDPTARVTAYPLDRTVWYGGLVLTFGTATATLDAKGGPVTVDLAIANPGPEDANLDGPVLLTATGIGVQPSRETVFPLVPAGGGVVLTVVFVVDGAFDVSAAAIRVGRSEEHQAVVPLVPGVIEAVTLEPVRFELSGSAQAGSLLVSVHAAELRADLPDWGMQLPRSSIALTLTYDATFRSDFAGGFAFTTENLGLLLADGRTLSAREDGHSAPALVIGPRATITGLQSRFEVPAPGIDLYQLLVRDGAATKKIELSVAGT